MTVRIIPAQPVRKTETVSPMQLRVAAYCRVSTDMKDQENSFAAQVTYYTACIARHKDWMLAGIYADEGISGTGTEKRAQFNNMIRACERHEVDLVLTKSISRFARNTLDCLNYIRKLKALNIPVWFEKESINTMGAGGELLLTILASIAQQESASISQNVRIGLQYAFRQGRPMLEHNRFMGYTKRRGDPVLTIVPEEAEVVRMMFRDFLEGYSYWDIGHDLEMQGIRSPGGREKWHYSTVKSMLTNEKFMGDLLLQKTFTADFLTKQQKKNTGELPQYYIENAHPPIVPREVFMRVRGEIMHRDAIRKEQGDRKTMSGRGDLQGKVACGLCGGLYRRCGGEVPRWRCKTRHQRYVPCEGRIVTEEELQNAIMEAFNRLPAFREELSRLEAQLFRGPMDRVNRELGEIEKRRKELADALSEHIKTGRLDRRLMLVYSDGENVEYALEAILQDSSCLEELYNRRLEAKSDLALREVQLHSLLKLAGQIQGREEQTEERESRTEKSAACSDLFDFYDRTDRITQRGLLEEYKAELAKRFVEKVIVMDGGVTVKFKAGLKITLD